MKGMFLVFFFISLTNIINVISRSFLEKIYIWGRVMAYGGLSLLPLPPVKPKLAKTSVHLMQKVRVGNYFAEGIPVLILMQTGMTREYYER